MTDTDTLTLEGKHTNARIHADDSLIEDELLDQVQSMVDHEAFTQDVEIMPDAHPGAGAVVGFTMPLDTRIVPNTVGVDIGCGMSAYRMANTEAIGEQLDCEPGTVDSRIREQVPLGRKTFGDVATDQDYHIVDDFPWSRCAMKVRSLNEQLPFDGEIDGDFGKEYFLDLCKRVGYDTTRAINSIGTLGGGNHFIEIAQSQETGAYWVVVHSGSRGIGLSIAEFWQERAHRNCDERATIIRARLDRIPEWAYKFDVDAVSDVDLLDWVQGGMGEDWKCADEIRDRLDGEDIGEMFDQLKGIADVARELDSEHELDYLDDDDRLGYLKDMAFAQTYAEESRRQMCLAVIDALETEPISSINSTHNYIDYADAVIRKGATRVQADELAVIPFNMRDGAVIVSGRGNDDWNQSAPHGAGRRGSRRWAHDTFDVEEFEAEMADVYSTSVGTETLDEAPMAYKDHTSVLECMQPTADVIDTLDPVLNIKAEH